MIAENIKTLLLVEDEVLVALGKQKELENYGYNVLLTNTGERAVEISKENNEIDLILMDIDLGRGIDGTIAAEIILRTRKIPIVFLSSHIEPEIVEKTEKITSYGYVVKSSSITVLDASIKMAFKLFDAYKKASNSEVRLNEAQHLVQIGSWELDLLTNTLYWSDEVYRIFDLEPQEFGATYDAFLNNIHPDDRTLVDNSYTESVKNKVPYNIVHRLLLKDGTLKIVNEQCQTYYNDDGKAIRSIGTVQDITERKKAEKALWNSQEQLEIITDHLPPLIAYVDSNEEYLYVNQSYANWYGRTKEEIIGRHLKEVLYKESYKGVSNNIERVLRGENISYENISYDLDGKLKAVKAAYIPHFDEEGKVKAFIATVSDITERKQAEAAAHASEEKFRQIAETIHEVFWIGSPDWKELHYVSPAYEKVWGRSCQSLHDNPLSWLDAVHTDDRKNVIAAIEEKSDRAVDDPGFPEYRVLQPNGAKRWISARAFPVYDESGQVIRVVGIAEDITERKKAEDAIKHQLLEKEIILKEVHHRIKNNFASIENLLSLQAQTISNPETLSTLTDVIGRIHSMQVLYEKLLLTDNYQVTSVKEYIDNLIEDIINLFPDNINLTVKKQIHDFQFGQDRLVPIGIIVNELITNTMKYAFPDKNSGLIEITLEENQGIVILTIKDNGIGLPVGFDIKTQKGFGLMLVEMLSQQIEGNFTIESNNGTKCILRFNI